MKTLQLSIVFLSSVYILECKKSHKTYLVETADEDDYQGRFPPPPPLINSNPPYVSVVVENLEAIKFSISNFCANDKTVSRCHKGLCVDEFSFIARSKRLKDQVQGIISVFSKMSRMFCVEHVCLIFKNLTSIMGLLHYSH